MKIAVVFPGQGSQVLGMGHDVYTSESVSPEIRALFDSADSSLGYSLTSIMFGEDKEALGSTQNTQPAMVLVSTALHEHVRSRIASLGDGSGVSYYAGHSLGEYSALVAGGVLSLESALLAVYHRGSFMQSAVPSGVGGMSAILGASDSDVSEVASTMSSSDSVVEVANFNCPGQVVVSGHLSALESFGVAIKERGAKRVIKLPVSAPFHSSLMVGAQAKMSPYLDKLTFAAPSVPIVSNVTGVSSSDVDEIKSALKLQVTSSVRWTDTITNLVASGVDTFIEIGSGSVLTGLIKKIDPNVTAISISKLDDISKLDALG